jgi:hypothetical protein
MLRAFAQDVDIVMCMTPLTREQFDAFSANLNDCPDKLLVRCAPAEPNSTVCCTDPHPRRRAFLPRPIGGASASHHRPPPAIPTSFPWTTPSPPLPPASQPPLEHSEQGRPAAGPARP